MSFAYPFQFAHWAVCTTGIAASLILTSLALWFRPRRAAEPADGWPALTLLKPFDGVDPGMERNLWSYLSAAYPGERQVLFCTDRTNAPGIAVVRSVLRRLEREPQAGVHAGLLLSERGETAPVNRKIWHLERGWRQARHRILVSGDSGTRLEEETLPSLVATLLAGPRRGLVWAPYTADRSGGLGSRLTRLVFSASSINFLVIGLLHRILRRPPFAAGGLFAVRREALDALGGFLSYTDQLAEDLDMARHLVEGGWEIAVSPWPVVQHPGHTSFAGFYRRMVRWAFIMWRYRDPLRIHFPLVVCALPLSLVTLPLAAVLYPDQALQFVLLTVGLWTARWVLGAVLLTAVSHRRLTADLLWGTPLVEMVLLVAYVRAAFMRSVRWRDQDLEVEEGGRMARSDR